MTLFFYSFHERVWTFTLCAASDDEAMYAAALSLDNLTDFGIVFYAMFVDGLLVICHAINNCKFDREN